MTDYTTSRTWTFAEEEGGTTSITVNDEHLTVDVFTGPDCDGTRSETHYVFVQRAEDYPYPSGTTSRTGNRWEDDTEVHCDDPQAAFSPWVAKQLGWALMGRWLTGQPEPR